MYQQLASSSFEF